MITNYSQSGVRYREYFDWKPRNVSDSVKYHGLHNLYIQRPGDSWSSRIRLQMEHFAFSKAPAWLLAWFMTSPFYRSSDDKSCFTQAGWLLTRLGADITDYAQSSPACGCDHMQQWGERRGSGYSIPELNYELNERDLHLIQPTP